MADPSDLELVERAKPRRRRRVRDLYRRHRDWVVALAERHTGNRDDALDVLQETFATCSGVFPASCSRPSSRRFSIRDPQPVARPHPRRRPEVDVDALADVLPAPPVASDGDVNRLLASLPSTHREVLVLRFADDLSLSQIARRWRFRSAR